MNTYIEVGEEGIDTGEREPKRCATKLAARA